MSSARIAKIDEMLRQAALNALKGPEVGGPVSDSGLARLRELGTELWLDTGNLEEARSLWKSEFSALTTNNTLANQVVQTGAMDDIAKEAVRVLNAADPELSPDEIVLELGFVVNCHIALRLVKAFGARVSVELHPDVSEDIDRTLHFAERYYAVCPERFTVKIPLTPEGYCAVARARAKGIPINYTLGFSARQNYLAALFSNPNYCNVFLGRLNQVVSENRLGDGHYIGEKAAMATQVAIRQLRDAGRTQTKMIAASMRSGQQMIDLAGCDVYTAPPKAAKEFMGMKLNPASLESHVGRDFQVQFYSGVDAKKIETLWEISDAVKALSDDLVSRGPLTLTGDDLREADADHKAGLFHRFTTVDVVDIQEQGKIPDLDRWEDEKNVALDNLMTQSALQSFAKDQAELDDHLRELALDA